MIILAQFITRLYRHVLLLYPASFLRLYKQEMAAVFTLRVREASAQGSRALLAVCWHELRDLPGNLLEAHYYARKENATVMKLQWFNYTPRQELRRARLLARVAGLILTCYMAYIAVRILQMGTFAAHSTPSYTLMALMPLGILLALRWEKIGGLVTVGGALLLGLTAAYSMLQSGLGLDSMLFAGLLYAAPYLAIGAVFYLIGRRAESQASVLASE